MLLVIGCSVNSAISLAHPYVLSASLGPFVKSSLRKTPCSHPTEEIRDRRIPEEAKNDLDQFAFTLPRNQPVEKEIDAGQPGGRST